MTTIRPRHKPLLIHNLSLGLLEKPDPLRTNYHNRLSPCIRLHFCLFKQRSYFSPTSSTSLCDLNFQRTVILNEKRWSWKPRENDRIAPLLGLVLQGSVLVKLPFPISRPAATHIRGFGWGFNGRVEGIRDLFSLCLYKLKVHCGEYQLAACLFSSMNTQWSLKDQEQQLVASRSQPYYKTISVSIFSGSILMLSSCRFLTTCLLLWGVCVDGES